MTNQQPEALRLAHEGIELHETNAPEYIVSAAVIRLHAENQRLKAVPMKYRRMGFNAQLQDENAELHAENERQREVMQQALDALEALHSTVYGTSKTAFAITTLREALEGKK